ncbi:MAG TPA: hypothetical protein VIM11_26760 [Tepidisphaeraceae bacterium]
MSEIMTSREEAAQLQLAFREAVKSLEQRGFTRAQIGSAMAGIGLALVQVHDGSRVALGIVNAARDALMADAASKN